MGTGQKKCVTSSVNPTSTVSGPKILFCTYRECGKRCGSSSHHIFFNYGDRAGKLRLNSENKLITMGRIHGMMANFSAIPQYLVVIAFECRE